MDSRQSLLVKTLVQMAWADQKLDEAERQMLARVLTHLGATPAEIESLQAEPENVDLEQLAATLPGLPERREAMRLLLKVAFVDDALTFEEFDLVGRLAEALGLTDEQMEQLRQEALKPEES